MRRVYTPRSMAHTPIRNDRIHGRHNARLARVVTWWYAGPTPCTVKRLLPVVVVCGLCLAAMSQAQGTNRTVFVGGTVVDSSSGETIAGALVRLAPLASAEVPLRPETIPPVDAVLTDGRGRFEFSAVPAGSYLVTTTKDGYFAGGYGKERFFLIDTPKPLSITDARTDLRIEMWRWAVLTGSVIDDAGEPVVGARVSVLRRTSPSDRPVYDVKSTVQTDDRGIFRAFSLEPGDYIACAAFVQTAMPSNIFGRYHSGTLQMDRHMRRQLMVVGEPVAAGSAAVRRVDDLVWFAGHRPVTEPGSVYETTCAPSTTSFAEAAVERLDYGKTSSPQSIRLASRQGVSVSGRLIGPNGPAGHTAVRLLSSAGRVLFRDTGLESAVSMTDDAGRFRLFGVPPGTYSIRSSLMASDLANATQASGLHWLASDVAVGDADVSGLELTFQKSFEITGKVVLEDDTSGLAPPPPISRFPVTLEPADSGQYVSILPGVPAADGTFSIKDLPPGRYLVRAPLPPPGWALRASTMNGRDRADDSFELPDPALGSFVVTFTRKVTDITVTAVGATGQPDSRSTIYLVPADRRYWTDYGWNPRRHRVQRANAEGQVRITGFPPGSYFVLAMAEGPAARPRGVIETFDFVTRTGERLDLSEGQKVQLRLRAGSGR
jgi:protocatechuate 3,4-dioxygenase beta subunit